MVQGGDFNTNPRQFQTGEYRKGQYGQNAPGFQQYNQGQGPQYQGFQQGQDPGFQGFQRGQDPSFQRADAGNFNFDYQSDPGYQFARDQGLSAIEGRASAQGNRFGGGTQKEMAQFASGLAAQDYGNQYNRARGAFEQDRGFGACKPIS